MPQLVQLEKSTKVPKTYVVCGTAGVLVLLVFFNIMGNFITNVLGFLYPAYASFKAIETTTKEDDVQWLTYWTVFGFFNIIEFFADVILYWLPLYYTMKSIFVLWLMLPQFKGAQLLYKQVIRPILLKESKKIDDLANKVKDKIEGDKDK